MEQVAAVLQLVPIQGRILSIDAALHRISHDEGCAAGAVVGARAVIPGAAAELGEQQQQYLFAGLVLTKIVEESLDIVRHVLPQRTVVFCLVGMGVERVVRGRGVQDARAEVGEVYLSQAFHILAED